MLHSKFATAPLNLEMEVSFVAKGSLNSESVLSSAPSLESPSIPRRRSSPYATHTSILQDQSKWQRSSRIQLQRLLQTPFTWSLERPAQFQITIIRLYLRCQSIWNKRLQRKRIRNEEDKEWREARPIRTWNVQVSFQGRIFLMVQGF